MRRISSLLAVFVGLTYAAVPARAEGVALGAGGGTLGYGVHIATEVNDFLVFRANGNFGELDVPDFGLLDNSLGGLDYDIDAEMRTVGLLVDFHPLGLSPIGAGFVLTGGVYYNDNEFTLTTDALAGDVGGGTLTGRLVSTMTFDKKYAPYVGLGYDGTFQGTVPISLFATAGVLFQGSPSVSSSLVSGTCTGCDFAVEAAEVEAAASEFEYYPVVAVGLSISF